MVRDKRTGRLIFRQTLRPEIVSEESSIFRHRHYSVIGQSRFKLLLRLVKHAWQLRIPPNSNSALCNVKPLEILIGDQFSIASFTSLLFSGRMSSKLGETVSVSISIHFVFLFLSSSSIMSVMTSFISNPAARTCCGIKLVAVIPGVVFISSKTGSPSAGII